MTDKLKKLADWLTLIIVFLLPWQTRYIWEAGQLNKGPYEYATISLYATDLLIIAAIGLAALASLFDKQRADKFHYKIYWLLILGLLFFTCGSIFVASDRLLTLFVWARLALGAGLAWLIIISHLDYKKILAVLLAAICLQGALAIWQFNQQATWGNKWLGLAAHQPSELGVSVVEITPLNSLPERWLRAYGSLDHPNMLGGLTGLGVILAVYLFINLNKTKNLRTKEVALSLALILTTAGLFFSFSRAAILGTATALLLLTIFQLKNWRRLLLAGLIIGLTIFILLAPYGRLYNTRLAALDGATVGARLETKSLAERATYLKGALALIKKHLLWGVGAGNYGLAVAQEIVPQQLSYYYQPVHNVFLLILAEIGALGLIFWLALLLKLLIHSFSHRPTTALNLALLALAVTIMFFDHWLWSLHFGVLFFWLIVGLIIKNMPTPTKTIAVNN